MLGFCGRNGATLAVTPRPRPRSGAGGHAAGASRAAGGRLAGAAGTRMRTCVRMRSFASDNNAGVPAQVLAAMTAANRDHAQAYGDDEWTARAEECVRARFGEQARGFLVFNGTAANVLALRATCRSWEGVICAASAHINVDEGGAPERIAGVKLMATPEPDGKLAPDVIDSSMVEIGDQHRVQPRLLSITQSTELGTCYALEELRELCAHAHERGLLVHMDGARLGNAAASLGVPLRELTSDVGVDVLCLRRDEAGRGGHRGGRVPAPGAGRGLPLPAQAVAALASKGRFLAAHSWRCSRTTSGSAGHARERDGAAPRRGLRDVDGV